MEQEDYEKAKKIKSEIEEIEHVLGDIENVLEIALKTSENISGIVVGDIKDNLSGNVFNERIDNIQHTFVSHLRVILTDKITVLGAEFKEL